MIFRPDDFGKRNIVRHRLAGDSSWSPLQQRPPAIRDAKARLFLRLHYLGEHAPKPVQKKWRPALNRLMKRWVPTNASMTYANTWSAERWL